MIPRDTICFYLAEGVKTGAETRFKGVSDEGVFLQARAAIPEMTASSNTLKKRLERAAKTGSRMDAIRRLNAVNSRGSKEITTAAVLPAPDPEVAQPETVEDGCRLLSVAV